MKIKNKKVEAESWVGMIIEPETYYTIQANELYKWSESSKVLTDIGNGNLLLNNDVEDITNVATAINTLLGVNTEPKDIDGSPLSRVKITKSGWHYQLHCIEFSTSKLAIDHSTDENETNVDFTTMFCYDAANNLITEEANLINAVKTVLEWEVKHDMDITGAMFYQLSQPSNDIRMYTIAAPHIPEANGGNKRFVQGGFNLKFLQPSSELKIDGKAPKTITYDPTYHSGKFQMVLKHSAGVVHKMQLVFEIFKP